MGPFRIIFFLGFLLLNGDLSAQLGFDIWVGSLKFQEGGSFSIGDLSNKTNRTGYDNQPFFIDKGSKILFSSDRNGKGTDIFELNLQTGELREITNSPESEYSPQLIPGKEGYSTVRIDTDEMQRFWLLGNDGKEKDTPFNIEAIGYNCWLNEDEVFFFIVGEEEKGGHQLAWGQIETGKLKAIERGIGRSLFATNATFYFTRDLNEKGFMIISLSPTGKNGKFDKKEITMLPIGTQDFIVFEDRFILTALRNQLLSFDLNQKEMGWKKHGNIVPGDTPEITRIAIDEENMKIALVISE
jgi:WD40-like Beta Propeller Repeat